MSLDLSGGEETDAGEAKILVVHKHFDWNDVGLTEVIDKTTYVSVTPGINAVSVTILETEEVVIIHGGVMNRKWTRGQGVKGLKHFLLKLTLVTSSLLPFRSLVPKFTR